MKNAIKVLCFTLSVILVLTGIVYFVYIWQKSDFEIEDGVNSGTAIITSYIGDSYNIKIPNRIRGKKVVSIDDSAFKGTDIVSVELNKYITSIGKDAFYNCTKLESVDLRNCRSIGETAFSNCTSLTEITIPASVEKLGSVPFLYDDALTNLTFEDGGSYTIKDNIIYSADMTELVMALPCAKLTTFTCPDSVTTIDPYAFTNQTELTSFTFSSNVTAIKMATFANCSSLKSLDIPSNITEIGSLPITGTAITKLTIPATVTKIDDNAFSDMTETLTICTTEGSVAQKFASDSGIKCEIIK